MLFSDPVFIFIFLPIVAFLYYVFVKYNASTLSKVFLIAASVFFYAYWYPPYTAILIISIVMNYLFSSYIGKRHSHYIKTAFFKIKTSKLILIVGLIFNVSLISYYKYADFILENLAVLFSVDVEILDITLPLAISFFTFQQIAYLVDKYKGEVKHSSFVDYILFVTFFPQLIAGPIVHHKKMMPQFKNSLGVDIKWNLVGLGLAIFILGLAKKVLIADPLSVWANQGFSAVDGMSLFDAWATSLSYTFQLYFDFSGYSDMAVGIAMMFGIKLPVNFNSPYKATNIQDFWRRWHITLSTWLRDYIYIPLGGNKLSVPKVYLNVLVTFLIGGLWHGAAWTFVLWGAMHGFGILLYRTWSSIGLSMPKALAWITTFLFVNFSWVFFRAESFSDAIALLKGMLGFNGAGISSEFAVTLHYFSSAKNIDFTRFVTELAIPVGAYEFVILSSVLAFFFPNTLQLAGVLDSKLKTTLMPKISHAFFLSVVFFLVCLTFFGDTAPSEFLYFNF